MLRFQPHCVTRASWMVSILLAMVCSGIAAAADGDPVAVRRWADGSVTVESHWNLRLGINTKGDSRNGDQPIDHSVSVADAPFDHVLFRSANSDAVQWQRASEISAPGQIHAYTINGSGTVARVDGVCVLVLANLSFESDQKLKHPVDVLVLPKLTSDEAEHGIATVKHFAPRVVLIDHASDTASLDAMSKAVGAEIEKPPTPRNTLAISKEHEKTGAPRLVVLNSTPWSPNEELKQLLDAMETSCSNSQDVFSKLSVNQLNFRPSNGTHTPRWNTEHMMGRQLLFFSQIYHELDPAIPVMDLNPKQMPPDYKAAHANWDGREEARQMQRVSDFTRRFAYLLDGIALDKPAPGSRWTLRGLLKQMERHYDEHTANTVKKFELPDWPQE